MMTLQQAKQEQATAVEVARDTERSADRAFAAGDDARAARLYRVAAKAYAEAGMPGSAAIVADAARCCTRWGKP